jgi:hypothetical protein
MKPQFENKAMSSLLLFLDHQICEKGEAYTNHGSKFYSIDSRWNGYYTYAAPFKQVVADQSITGANQLSGVYINNSFTTGSPVQSINHHEGLIIFDASQSTVISGNYAIKDYNIYLTSKTEEELLFETKFELRPKTTQSITGLQLNEQTYPAIFIRNEGGRNDPFAFGGEDMTHVNAGMVILGDSAYSVDAVCSILKDSSREWVPMIERSELPFDAFGGSTSGYNYTGICEGKAQNGKAMYIKNTYVSRDITRLMGEGVNKNVHAALATFEMEIPRMPRGNGGESFL